LEIGLTRRGRAFILVSAALVAIGLAAGWEAGGQWPLVAAGLGGLLLTYGVRLTLLAQSAVVEMVRLRRVYEADVVEGSEVEVRLVIENPTHVSVYNVEVVDRYPETMRLLRGANHAVVSIPAAGSVELSYVLSSRMIGVHEFGGTSFALRDPLGMFYCRVEREAPDELRVYPVVYEPEAFTAIFPGSRTLTGTSYARKKGSGFEFADIREYQPGDELRRIEWKATARLGRLMIKEFDAEGTATIVIVLDASGTMAYGAVGERKLDYAARTVAYLTRYLQRRRDYVGFVLFDGRSHVVLPVSPPDQAMPRIYRLLGCMRAGGAVDKRGLGKVLLDSIPALGLKENALFILISDLEGDIGDLPDALARLRAMKHEVVVISPLTPLFEAPALERWEGVMYRVLTVDYWVSRDRTVSEVASRGIPVINVGPRDFIPAVIARIEDYRRRIAI